MNRSSPKVAIFYDWLNQWGGAERVLIDILKIYPSAHLYTLVFNPKKTSWLPFRTKVFTTSINHLPHAHSNPIIYTPLYTIALKRLDLSAYDIIISTTSTIGHQLTTSKKQLYVCYFHNINRYLYYTPPKYLLLKPFLKIYQLLDTRLALNPNHLLCNSKTVQQRIECHYHRQAQIIHPGVNVKEFIPVAHPSNDYFLIVSRLVTHKNIDLAIHACQSLRLPLKIVGIGRESARLKNISTKTTQFLGQVDHQQLINLYQNCLALIHPQVEDFGLTSLEVQSCGKPVIALRSGGATETVINRQTGIFFNHPTTQSLTRAVKNFKSAKFSPTACRNQAIRFSQNNFMLNFKNTIDALWQAHIS